MLQPVEPVGDEVLQGHFSSHDCLHKLRNLSPGCPTSKAHLMTLTLPVQSKV